MKYLPLGLLKEGQEFGCVKRLARAMPACMIAFISACSTTSSNHSVDAEFQDLGTVKYKIVMHVATEPPNCRVYLQDQYQGDSPLDVVLICPPVKALRYGIYPARYTGKESYVRLGPTVWSKHLFLHNAEGPAPTAKGQLDCVQTATGHPIQYWSDEVSSGATPVVSLSYSTMNNSWNRVSGFDPNTGWMIKAFHEGYVTQTRRISVTGAIAPSDPSLSAGDNIPEEITATQSILLILQPSSTVVQMPGEPQSQRQVQSTDQGRAAAQAEYNAALNAYNEALKKLNEEQALEQANRVVARGNMGSRNPIVGTVGAVGNLTSSQLVRDAEREVEIARQRLEAVKTSLYKY